MTFDTEVRKAPRRVEEWRDARPPRRGAWLRWTAILMVVGLVAVLLVVAAVTNDSSDGFDPADITRSEFVPRSNAELQPYDMHLSPTIVLPQSIGDLKPFDI